MDWWRGGETGEAGVVVVTEEEVGRENELWQ